MVRIIGCILTIIIAAALLLGLMNFDALSDRLFHFRDQIYEDQTEETIVGIVTKENNIALYADTLSEDDYTLWYENTNGKLQNYGQICTLTVSNEEIPVYTGLIPENCAPQEASVIGVYDSQDQRVGGILLGTLQKDFGKKLYTFGALSDVHMGYPTSTEDFTKALEFLIHHQWTEFVCVAGDITASCADDELQAYQQVVSEFSRTAPVYAIRGNHDSPEYRKGDVTGLFEMPLYYSFQCNEDVFIMLGNAAERTDTLFSREEMQWLYETLEANKHRRCFIFQHIRPVNSSGNALGIYTYDLWDGTEQALFEELLEHYPNVTLFHGHTHLEFALQEYDEIANYTAKDGYHSVHIPSATVPRTGTVEGPSSRVDLYYESQGYLVDVYENGIVLRGRDFIQDVYLPIAQYYLDTTLQDTKDTKISKDPCTIHWDSEGIILDWSRGLKTQKSAQPQVEVAGYASSHKIDLQEGYRYRLCSKNALSLEAFACFYDSEGNYLDFTTIWDADEATSQKKSVVQEISIPQGAASMILRLDYPPETTDQKLSEKLAYLSLTKFPDSKS